MGKEKMVERSKVVGALAGLKAEIDDIAEPYGGKAFNTEISFVVAKMQKAIEATMKRIPLNSYAANHIELAGAIRKWGR